MTGMARKFHPGRAIGVIRGYFYRSAERITL